MWTIAYRDVPCRNVGGNGEVVECSTVDQAVEVVNVRALKWGNEVEQYTFHEDGTRYTYSDALRRCKVVPGVKNAEGPVQPLTDLKASLSSGIKADLTHIRTGLVTYGSRNGEYGDDKYQRGNYLRPMPSIAEDFKRLRGYLRANITHTMKCLDSMELHQSQDPELKDVEGMKKACYAVDTDPDLTGKVGPSLLPHLGGSVASLNMGLQQAINAGLLPADPGQPWKDKK